MQDMAYISVNKRKYDAYYSIYMENGRIKMAKIIAMAYTMAIEYVNSKT